MSSETEEVATDHDGSIRLLKDLTYDPSKIPVACNRFRASQVAIDVGCISINDKLEVRVDGHLLRNVLACGLRIDGEGIVLSVDLAVDQSKSE